MILCVERDFDNGLEQEIIRVRKLFIFEFYELKKIVNGEVNSLLYFVFLGY